MPYQQSEDAVSKSEHKMSSTYQMENLQVERLHGGWRWHKRVHKAVNDTY